MTCLQCGGKLVKKRENYRYTSCGLSNVTLVGVEVRRCPRCGDHEVVIPRIEELHRVLAAAVVRRTSRLAKEEVRFLRKYLGYSGVDFAKVIGVSSETISRWENGKERMGASAEKLVRMLVVHQQPIRDYSIESLAKISDKPSKPSAKPIGVRVKGVGWVEQELEAARKQIPGTFSLTFFSSSARPACVRIRTRRSRSRPKQSQSRRQWQSDSVPSG